MVVSACKIGRPLQVGAQRGRSRAHGVGGRQPERRWPFQQAVAITADVVLSERRDLHGIRVPEVRIGVRRDERHRAVVLLRVHAGAERLPGRRRRGPPAVDRLHRGAVRLVQPVDVVARVDAVRGVDRLAVEVEPVVAGIGHPGNGLTRLLEAQLSLVDPRAHLCRRRAQRGGDLIGGDRVDTFIFDQDAHRGVRRSLLALARGQRAGAGLASDRRAPQCGRRGGVRRVSSGWGAPPPLQRPPPVAPSGPQRCPAYCRRPSP